MQAAKLHVSDVGFGDPTPDEHRAAPLYANPRAADDLSVKGEIRVGGSQVCSAGR